MGPVYKYNEIASPFAEAPARNRSGIPLTVSILLLALSACRVDGPVEPSSLNADETIQIEPNQATMALGGNLTLTATVLPETLESDDLSWLTPDAGVATVSPNGVVHAMGVGTVRIAAISQDGEHAGFSTIVVVEEGGGGEGGGGEGGGGEGGGGEGGGGEGGGGEGGGGSGGGSGGQCCAGGTPGTNGANEPSNMFFLSDRSFAAEEEAGWTWPVRDNNIALRSESSAPKSSPTVVRMDYPAGHTGGTAPFGPMRTDLPSGTTELYMSIWIRYSANWQGHDSGVNKLFYVNATTGNIWFANAYGANANPLTWQVNLQMVAANNLRPNKGNATMQMGQWYQLELYMVMNTGGNADGELHGWVNGLKTHEYTAVRWAAASDPHSIDHIKFSSIWGGVGDQIQQSMWYEIDHIYMSIR